MADLKRTLASLLALATLRDDEEGDEARENEARNAAMQLLKLCRKNGVKLKFLVPSESTSKPDVDRGTRPRWNPFSNPFDVDDFANVIDQMNRRTRERAEANRRARDAEWFRQQAEREAAQRAKEKVEREIRDRYEQEQREEQERIERAASVKFADIDPQRVVYIDTDHDVFWIRSDPIIDPASRRPKRYSVDSVNLGCVLLIANHDGHCVKCTRIFHRGDRVWCNTSGIYTHEKCGEP